VSTATTSEAKRTVNWNQVMVEGRALIALVLIVIVFAAMNSNFLSPDNLIIMTRHVAMNAILAVGMLMVILNGGIDLSVGSVVGLSGIVAGWLLQGVGIPFTGNIAYPSVWVVIVISLLVGVFVGWINGVVVSRWGVAPFVATLGMLYMARGAALLISNGETFTEISGDPSLGNTGFVSFVFAAPLGIPSAVWVMVAVAILASLLLNRTPFGRWLYASGGNERASILSGIPIKKVQTRIYILSALCAALVGLLLVADLKAAVPKAGEFYELNAIAAVVIGGAALSGGRGTVRGTIIGAFVIGFLVDGLVLVGVSVFWQVVIKGAVIVLAVAVDQAQQRLQKTRAMKRTQAKLNEQPPAALAPPTPEPEKEDVPAP
jgi:erythritol transport system permease protein